MVKADSNVAGTLRFRGTCSAAEISKIVDPKEGDYCMDPTDPNLWNMFSSGAWVKVPVYLPSTGPTEYTVTYNYNSYFEDSDISKEYFN